MAVEVVSAVLGRAAAACKHGALATVEKAFGCAGGIAGVKLNSRCPAS